MPPFHPKTLHRVLAGSALLALSACSNTMDWDMRHIGKNGLDTSEAARNASTERPKPDDRGVISYPNYQVALAQRGDTVSSVASRIGLPAAELAQYNALDPNMPLREGEILALPQRVADVSPTTTAIGAAGQIDITTLASGAIERAGSNATPAVATAPTGAEPVRHKVARGETAYSIARLYNVSANALADWNSLGPDMAIREGQYLLIPVAGASPTRQAAAVTSPGQGSPTPQPPSAAKPLPAEAPQTAAQAAAATPVSPNLGSQASSAARFAFPVDGRIIRGYEKKKNDGIDIASSAGTAVKAAADGTVAAITRDTEQVAILVVRHPDNLLTVYANVDSIKVAKGDTVKRGQSIAAVRAGDPAFVHFEVRKGFESVDPMPYLQ